MNIIRLQIYAIIIINIVHSITYLIYFFNNSVFIYNTQIIIRTYIKFFFYFSFTVSYLGHKVLRTFFNKAQSEIISY